MFIPTKIIVQDKNAKNKIQQRQLHLCTFQFADKLEPLQGLSKLQNHIVKRRLKSSGSVLPNCPEAQINRCVQKPKPSDVLRSASCHMLHTSANICHALGVGLFIADVTAIMDTLGDHCHHLTHATN